MVFTSRRRTAPHLTPPTETLPRAVGTKLGERCQHKYHCWFRHQCRGWHPELEQQHFADCEASATKLEAPYCAAGVCIRDGCNGAHNVDHGCQPTKGEPDIFFDTVLAPRRRLHRRLRKRQRARRNRQNRGEIRTFQRARRQLEKVGLTKDVEVQTEQKLRSRMTQTVQADCTSNRHTAYNSAK